MKVDCEEIDFFKYSRSELGSAYLSKVKEIMRSHDFRIESIRHEDYKDRANLIIDNVHFYCLFDIYDYKDTLEETDGQYLLLVGLNRLAQINSFVKHDICSDGKGCERFLNHITYFMGGFTNKEIYLFIRRWVNIANKLKQVMTFEELYELDKLNFNPNVANTRFIERMWNLS